MSPDRLAILQYRKVHMRLLILIGQSALCRLGTTIVFVALYYKSFGSGSKAPQAPRPTDTSKSPLRSPSKSPGNVASGSMPQWDMESAGKRSNS